MNEQQRPWRLPEGVKFYVWPKYLLIVEGVEVKLSPTQAKIVLFLMSHPGRRWLSNEIAEEIFADREDGGPADRGCIAVHVFSILNRCAKAGVNLCLKMPGAALGYAFMGVSLTAKGRSEAIRLKSLPESDPQSPSHPGKFRFVNEPKPPKNKKGLPRQCRCIHFFNGTTGWTFPERVERHLRTQQPAIDKK